MIAMVFSLHADNQLLQMILPRPTLRYSPGLCSISSSPMKSISEFTVRIDPPHSLIPAQKTLSLSLHGLSMSGMRKPRIKPWSSINISVWSGTNKFRRPGNMFQSLSNLGRGRLDRTAEPRRGVMIASSLVGSPWNPSILISFTSVDRFSLPIGPVNETRQKCKYFHKCPANFSRGTYL